MNNSNRPPVGAPSVHSDYSTTVIKSHSRQGTTTVPPALSSILTIRSPQPTQTVTPALDNIPTVKSNLSIESFHTASSSVSSVSSANATRGGSTVGSTPSTHIHRFTLIKVGAKRDSMGEMPKYKLNPDAASSSANGNGEQMWSPFGFFFSNALSAKCDLCGKRLGRKPVLECDDCGMR